MKAIKWQSMLLLLGVSLKCSFGVLRGQCRECLANNVACLDERAFATCLNGKVTNNLTRCPLNTVCTAESTICQSPIDGFRPVCYNDDCGSCERTNGIFACQSATIYGFCYGQTEPDPDSMRQCPFGSVCNVESATVCVAESEGGIASCVPDDETPTTEPPPTQAPTIDPDTFCGNQKSTGNFKASDDTTCREYIFCYLLAGQYLGNRYICADYFNAESRQCQAEKPMDC